MPSIPSGMVSISSPSPAIAGSAVDALFAVDPAGRPRDRSSQRVGRPGHGERCFNSAGSPLQNGHEQS